MAGCVRFKNPFDTVGASFRFFASNATLRKVSMPTAHHRQAARPAIKMNFRLYRKSSIRPAIKKKSTAPDLLMLVLLLTYTPISWCGYFF